MKEQIAVLTLFCLVIVLGCVEEQKVGIDDTVSVDYNLTMDGLLIDSSAGDRPFTFVVGSDSVIKGFSYGVIGMKVGETRTFVVGPKEGYGEPDPDLIVVLPKGNMTPPVGTVFTDFNTKRKGIISGENGTHVFADFNNPLAGKNLTFEVKLLEIRKAVDYFNP
jgi:FKBP-type peptidyl-prolyl cis-trans isomerase 2